MPVDGDPFLRALLPEEDLPLAGHVQEAVHIAGPVEQVHLPTVIDEGEVEQVARRHHRHLAEVRVLPIPVAAGPARHGRTDGFHIIRMTPARPSSMEYAPSDWSSRFLRETRRRARPVTLSSLIVASGRRVSAGWSKLYHSMPVAEPPRRMRFPVCRSRGTVALAPVVMLEFTLLSLIKKNYRNGIAINS